MLTLRGIQLLGSNSLKYERSRTFLNDNALVPTDIKWIKIDKEGNEINEENDIEDYDGDDKLRISYLPIAIL